MSSRSTDALPLPAGGPEEATHAFEQSIGRISTQSLVFLLGTFFTVGSGYFFKMYVSRVLGAEGLGLYALGMSVVSFFGLFATFGFPQTASRYTAVYAATRRWDSLRTLLWGGALAMLVVGILGAAAVVATGDAIARRLYGEPILGAYMPLFACMVPASALTFFLSQSLGGFQDVARRTVINSFVGVPLTMALVAAFFQAGLGLWGYLAAQVAGALVIVGLLLAAVWRRTPREARSPRGPFVRPERELFAFASSMLAIGVLEFVLGQTDRIMLGVFDDAADVGVYTVAATTALFIPVVLQSVNSIFAPMIADLHARREPALLGRLYATVTRWIVASTTPLVGVVVVFSPTLMGFFGSEFEAGWPVLVILAVGQLVNCGVGPVGYMLLMSGNEGCVVRAQAVSGLGMLVASVALVPVWGAVGAALASAGASAAMNILLLLDVRRRLGVTPDAAGTFRLAAPIGAALGAILLVGWWGHGWRDVLVATICAYLAMAMSMRVLGLGEDDKLILEMIRDKMRTSLRRK